MTQTAREIADDLCGRFCSPDWRCNVVAVSLCECIEAALLAYGNARIEEAAKVVEDFAGRASTAMCAKGIRSLVPKDT